MLTFGRVVAVHVPPSSVEIAPAPKSPTAQKVEELAARPPHDELGRTPVVVHDVPFEVFTETLDVVAIATIVDPFEAALRVLEAGSVDAVQVFPAFEVQ